ncbi:MAG: hypothetical protein OHK0031_13010 [Anaerolineales bacterium]
MKKILLLLIFLLALSACAPATPPAPTPDQAATVSAMAESMVAETLTAAPTATATATATLPPTETPVPASTTPAETATPGESATPSATFTPLASPTMFQGTLAPAGLPNDERVGWIVLSNESDFKDGTITLNGITAAGEKPVYFSYAFTRVLKFYLPWGTYKYYITAGPKKSFSGEFRINNWDKTMIVIRNDKLLVRGP